MVPQSHRSFRSNFVTFRPDDPRTGYTDAQLVARYLHALGLPGRLQEGLGALLVALDASVFKGAGRQRYATYEDLRAWVGDLLGRRVTDYGLRQLLKAAHAAGLLTWTSGYGLPTGQRRCNVYRSLVPDVLARWATELARPDWFLALTGRLVAQVVPIVTRGLRAVGDFGRRLYERRSPRRGGNSPTQRERNYSQEKPQTPPPTTSRSLLVGENAPRPAPMRGPAAAPDYLALLRSLPAGVSEAIWRAVGARQAVAA